MYAANISAQIPTTGTTGQCTWTITQNPSGKYTLTISGTGTMANYSNYSSSLPWNGFRPLIETLVITDGVTSIGNYAFSGCGGLTAMTIPGNVIEIGAAAFMTCGGLTSISIGNGVSAIESYSFWGCSGLTSITIPNSLVSIGASAFSDCSGLTSITIPNSVTSIGANAFSGCTGLTSVTVQWTTPLNINNNGIIYFL